MTGKKQKKKLKKAKKFDYDYCMKRPNCKFCKYALKCEQFSKENEILNKNLKDKKV